MNIIKKNENIFYICSKKKLKTKINISLLFTLVVLCEIYIVSFRINLLIQAAFFLILIFSGKSKLSFSFMKMLYPLIGIFFLGFLGSILESYYLVDIIKDISHFIKPIFVLCIGFLTFKSINNQKIFLRTIIHIAAITAIIHVAGILLFSKILTHSISNIRGDYGLDNFIEIFAFFFLILAPKSSDRQLYKNDIYRKILIVIFVVSIMFYFSRTMFGMIFILGLSFYGYAKLDSKSVKIIGLFAVIVVLFYAYLDTIKPERNSKGIEALLYKIKMAPGEVFNAKLNREDHTKLWDHWRAYEAKRAIALMNDNPTSYIFGNGHGSLVDLKFKAPLGLEKMRYISVLHNGYIFVFYKTGILGILFYFIFLVKLYLRNYHNETQSEVVFIKILIATIGCYFLFTSLIISGIYIPQDTILFILGGALFYEKTT